MHLFSQHPDTLFILHNLCLETHSFDHDEQHNTTGRPALTVW